MAWTQPRTWMALETVTAALLNTHVRDNLLETGPAKVTTAGDLLYATGANAITRLGVGSEDQLLTVASGLPAWASPSATAKAADETVSASTTLQNDDDFSFAIAANEIWQVTLTLYVVESTTGGFKSAFTVPAACTGFHGLYTNPDGVTTAVSDFDTTITTEITCADLGTGGYVLVEAVIVNGANAGTVQFQWAQNSAAGTTIVKANSSMARQRLSP